MSIELIRKINELERRIDALIFPEISKGGGGDPATIDISFADFLDMFVLGGSAKANFPPDTDEIAVNIYPYTGTHTGSTITVKLFWIDVDNTLTGDVVLQCGLGSQAEGEVWAEVWAMPPVNTETVTETVPGVPFEIAMTTFTFTEAYEPDDIITIFIARLGTDSGDTCPDTISPLCAKITFS